MLLLFIYRLFDKESNPGVTHIYVPSDIQYVHFDFVFIYLLIIEKITIATEFEAASFFPMFIFIKKSYN